MFDFLKKTKRGKQPAGTESKIEQEEFDDITPVARYFKLETGVDFDRHISILTNKVTTFCRQHDIYSFIELLARIEQKAELRQGLIDYLTTNESYFYREIKQIEELVRLAKKRESAFSILCAPSATGEEPFSLAIALLEARIPGDRFKITGIDINQEAIEKAWEAKYKERSVQNLSEEMKNRYFFESNGSFMLQQNIRSLVTFQKINLFDHDLQKIGRFDFIFSRNMLIYFDKTTKVKAIKILESLRKDDRQAIFFGHADLF